MSNRSLSLVLAFLIPVLFTLAMPYTAGDLSVWITQGDYFLSTGNILRHDIFSVLPTAPLIYPSFGISVIYAVLYRILGLVGLCVFHGLIILPVLLFCIYWPLIQSGEMPGSGKLKWALFLFWLGAVPIFVERPAMVALIPLVLAFQIIARSKQEISQKDALKLILIEILWVNTHGSFVLLPLMLAWRFCFGFKQLKAPGQEAALVGLVFLSSLLNPFGYAVYPYILETAKLSKERGISEWDFPALTTQFPTGMLFWFVFIVSAFYLFRSRQRKIFWNEVANPFFLFLLLGTLSIRNAALAFVLLLPALHSLAWLKRVNYPQTVGRSNIWIALLALLAVPLVIHSKPKKWDETVAFSLSDKIKADGRTCAIFNDWELGSFLMLRLPNRIYLDTRNIIYSPEEFQAYRQTLQGELIWKSFLARGNACFVLVNRTQGAGLLQKLKGSPEWEWREDEGQYTLYVKKKI